MHDQRFRLLRLAAAGAAAGLIIFLIFNPSTARQESMGPSSGSSLEDLILSAMLLGFAFAAMTGGLLLISEEFGSPAKRIASRLASAAAVSAAAGVTAGAAAQLLYTAGVLLAAPFELISRPIAFVIQSAARAAGWAVMGGGAGLGIGYALGSWKRARMSCLGGLAGGFVGGLVFDTISLVTGGGSVSRFVGFTLMGTAIGAAVSLVEDLVKQNWVTILSGPKEGRSYILTKPATTIGRDELADIPLFSDPAVAKQHAVLRLEGARVTVESLAGKPILVNGSPALRSVLQDSDTLKVGSISLRFHQKKSGAQAAGPKRWFEPSGNVPETRPPAASQMPKPEQPPTPQSAAAPSPGPHSGSSLILTVTTGPHANQTFRVGTPGAVIGRAAGCAVLLDRDTMVSRTHAELVWEDSKWTLRDLGSTNGVWVNGSRTASAVLRPGDEIRVGQSVLRVSSG